MRVYLIRHGESENNLARCFTGWMDVALTPKGECDAERAGALLRGIRFDKIYTSDLQRAKRTAEIALPGCVYETSPLLREINVGSLSGKHSSFITDETRQRIREIGYVEFGGETKQELCDRVAAFMRRLEALDYENVAVFAHAGILLNFLNEVMGAPIGGKVVCDNCAVAVFEYGEKGWLLHSWINHT